MGKGRESGGQERGGKKRRCGSAKSIGIRKKKRKGREREKARQGRGGNMICARRQRKEGKEGGDRKRREKGALGAMKRKCREEAPRFSLFRPLETTRGRRRRLRTVYSYVFRHNRLPLPRFSLPFGPCQNFPLFFARLSFCLLPLSFIPSPPSSSFLCPDH